MDTGAQPGVGTPAWYQGVPVYVSVLAKGAGHVVMFSRLSCWAAALLQRLGGGGLLGKAPVVAKNRDPSR